MVILLLVLAYFLPRLCAHRMLEQKMQKQVILEIGGGDSSAAFV